MDKDSPGPSGPTDEFLPEIAGDGPISVAVHALEAIANGAEDAWQLAATALKELRELQRLAYKFHVPLASTISGQAGTDVPHELALSKPRCSLVRAASEPGPPALVRTCSRNLPVSLVQPEPTFGVDVFCVDEGCTKSLRGLRQEDTLAALLEMVKDEFALDGANDVKLVCGMREFGQDDLQKSLASLGLSDGASLSFTEQKTQDFDVNVSTITGKQINVSALLPDMNLASLVNAVEQELGLTGDEVAQLLVGTTDFQPHDLGKTLNQLGIHAGAELTCYIRLRPKGGCSVCGREYYVRRDVTTGGMHEGWGRKWNTCNYDCIHCGVRIQGGESVNVCTHCKCFWHRSCKIAGR
mmetsp:Transcript_103321/g.287618  ORF Transcript_103321/g.287618 Transcript_103321/m.287618 type:complete len:354 (+) Transcript_103321:54-1115(+)